MHGICTDQWWWSRPPDGMDEHGFALPAPEPAVAADQLLERGNFFGEVVDPTVDDDVPDVGESAVPPYLRSSVHPEACQRIHALDALFVQEVPPIPTHGDEPMGI